MDASPYAGPIAVTTATLLLWYGLLMGLQSRTKYRLRSEYAARGESFDRYFGQDRRMLAADRAVANTQEQLLPFLVSLWLHAVFVSTTSATALGAVWVLLRAAYPLLLGSELAGTQSKRVFFATGPSYAVVAWLVGSTLVKALTG
ncbi:MAG: MAPEG family protein [Alphaproteobacteria bacterium]|nr:MAPEG family protein [Alphaproteobacteria bacterium]